MGKRCYRFSGTILALSPFALASSFLAHTYKRRHRSQCLRFKSLGDRFPFVDASFCKIPFTTSHYPCLKLKESLRKSGVRTCAYVSEHRTRRLVKQSM